MSNRPFFSFIIPTKNRCGTLKHSIQSCLNQTYEDFEIVVSDNNSKDCTKKVCDSFSEGKIRYFNTYDDIPAQNNFENGLKYATGRYILFLADDEAYTPHTLEVIKEIIDKTRTDVISFGRKAHYIHPSNGQVHEKINSLQVAPFTNKKYWVNSEDLLDSLISSKGIIKEDFGYSHRAWPLTVKTAVSKKIIDEIVNDLGFFHQRALDWSSCVFILSKIKKLVLYDRHLNMAGAVDDSGGPSYVIHGKMDEETQKSLENIITAPIKAPVFRNLIIDGILTAQSTISPKLDRFKLNPEYYTHELLRDLHTWKLNGIDTEAMLKEIRDYMKKNNVNAHNGFMYHFDDLKKIKPGYYLYLLKKSILNISKFFENDRSVWTKIYKGKNHGFNNISEAMDFFLKIEPTLLENKYANKLMMKHFPNAELIE